MIGEKSHFLTKKGLLFKIIYLAISLNYNNPYQNNMDN